MNNPSPLRVTTDELKKMIGVVNEINIVYGMISYDDYSNYK
jgi:hypothetical protein